ncbi:hypothetical protein P171DRAFT_447294 [Karstenula rhodostoma CBS 690.94]|uniref:BZIP domain-containing protein n=1 Tax=Karstenula rhodostoma CBS 690.94 TaxID=1392251 RepID=A0A9P4PAK3_9PLEO|nr:hypothetical protein P171DRAFT_447294 [Karstenula rhodostoma CBS 690.94]
MVNRRSNSDASNIAPLQSVAPVVKRKRRASCLGEQERKERKRAIDREAQRSLREKTKTHIAELERTIEILRNQDRNGAKASLLTEIEGLRAENEKLKDVIDGVRSVIGGGMLGRMAPAASTSAGGSGARLEDNTPMDESAGPTSPGLRRDSVSYSQAATDAKPPLLPSPGPTPPDAQYPSTPFDFASPIPAASRAVDLDGMTTMPIAISTSSSNDSALDLSLALDDVTNEPTQEDVFIPAPDSPATAIFAPFVHETELIRSAWNGPSPIVIHLDDQNDDRPLSSSASISAICPIWCNQTNSSAKSIRTVYPHQQMERLAAGYKSFKLLKVGTTPPSIPDGLLTEHTHYYINPTKGELDKVPTWLRPTLLQSSTSHPIAIDMFAWPSLRNRLVHHQHTLFRNSKLSHNYANFLRFDWPFSFEDSFYYDDAMGGWCPSPLFERYHSDVRSWTVEEGFWDGLEEHRGDIEGCSAG